MKGFLLYLFIVLRIAAPNEIYYSSIYDKLIVEIPKVIKEQTVSPMKALDIVKHKYASDFEKVYVGTTGQYYYKLSTATYYLAYEGKDSSGKNYLIHLYEFVEDDPDTNMGHAVTYGWYTVDMRSGDIAEEIEYLQ